ncbi:hypothetical protein [Nonomuraea roseola]|uniref:Uncharacterized protein n=1 Tax=Nonomuraea roseola TaxID=46179 RepID=A0ABV5Q568_9ACTN
MRVQMLITMSGTRDGVEWPARGGYIDLSETEAHTLISMGAAQAADEDDEVLEADADTAQDSEREQAGDRPLVEAAAVDHDQAETADAPAKPTAKRGRPTRQA